MYETPVWTNKCMKWEVEEMKYSRENRGKTARKLIEIDKNEGENLRKLGKNAAEHEGC